MSSSTDGFDQRFYEKIASLTEPDKTLPPNLYLCHTERTVTVIEQYPKSKIHVIMIPRVGAAPRVPANLTNLRRWLKNEEVPRSEARALLLDMERDAKALIPMLEEEMEYSYGYSSDFWMGFRVTSSYNYLHMHIMSNDLTGDYMKSPKHFFFFHPHSGYFYRLEKVLSWFDILEERFQFNLRELETKMTTPIPHGREVGYNCYHYRVNYDECITRVSSFPAMRAHLEEHAEEVKAAFIREKQQKEDRRRREAERQAGRAARERENCERNAG